MAQTRGRSLESYPHALLRIVAGFTFTLHGYQKVFGLFGGLGHGQRAALFSLLWIAGVIESIGGPLIILGLFTRPVAFLLCGEMAVAYFSQHAPHGFWPDRQRRRTGGTVLFHLFVFGEQRRGAVQLGSGDPEAKLALAAQQAHRVREKSLVRRWWCASRLRLPVGAFCSPSPGARKRFASMPCCLVYRS